MTEKALQGKTALVTGASSGIGEAIARELAAMGAGLVLVARREDRMKVLAAELAQKHGVGCEVVASDLSTRGAPQALFDKVQGHGIDVLVNNAGFGLHGNFVDLSWDRQREMIDLDILTLTHLTHLFAKPMVARGSGYVLQVASIGAFQPSPTYAVYSAAKAYVLSFGEALNLELKGTGVSCTTVCPGFTRTEFAQVAGQADTRMQRMTAMTAEQVAHIALKAMLHRKGSVVPGMPNALTAFLVRFVPRRTAGALAGKMVLTEGDAPKLLPKA